MTVPTKPSSLVAAGICGSLLLGLTSAPAADFVFQTGGANDWWVNGNWSLPGVPNSTADRAIFNNPAGGTTNAHPSPNPPGSPYTVNEMLFDTAGNWAVFNNERDINMQAAVGVARITQDGAGIVTYDSDWLLGSDTVLGGTGTGDVILNGSLVNNAASRKGIFGTGNLTKEGTFTATINAASIGWTGDATVNGGTLNLQNSLGLGTSSLTLNGGTLKTNVNLANDIVLNAGANTIEANGFYRQLTGVISGAGGFTLASGGGTPGLQLTNSSNSFTGDITINPGTYLRLTASEVIPDAVSVTNNGNFRLDVPGGGTETIAGLSGTGGVWVPTSNSNLQTLRVGSGGATDSFAGNFGQSGQNNAFLALEKIGAGTQTMTGGAAATGGITVTEGTLRLQMNRGFNQGYVTNANNVQYTIANGATLELAGNWITRSNSIYDVDGGTISALNPGGDINYVNLLNFDTAPGTVDGTSGIRTGYFFDPTYTVTAAGSGSAITTSLRLFDQGAVTSALTLDIADGAMDADFTISGQILDDPSWVGLGITKTGAGKLLLNNPTNNTKGPVQINGGTVSTPHLAPGNTPSAIGAAFGVSSFLGFDGGTLEYTGPTVSGINRAFTLNAGGGTIDVTQATTTLEWTDNAGAGPIIGAGSLTKAGPGTLILEGANAHTGGTIVSEGILQGNTNSSFGTGTVTLGDANTGTGDIALYAAGTADPGNAIVVAASTAGTVRIGANGTGFSNNIFNGPITLNREVTFTGDFDRTTFGGVISGNPGTVTIEHSPDLAPGTTGRVTWENNNTFTGDVDIKEDAILQVGSGGRNQIPTGANVNIDAGGQLWLVFDDEAINGLTGAGTVQFFNGGGLGANRLTVGEGDANASFSGTIQNGSPTAMNLTKTGTGTQELTGTNPYTGDTDVEGGVLLVSAGGAITQTGNASIAAGATLQLLDGDVTTTGVFDIATGGALDLSGGGDLTTPDTVWGGSILDSTPVGDAFFSETDGTLASTATSILDLQEIGNVFDLVGGLDLAAGGTLDAFDLIPVQWAAEANEIAPSIYELLLVDATAPITGDFANELFPGGALVDDGIGNLLLGGQYFVETRGNQLYLVANIPEPSRALLLGLGILALVVRRRR